MRVYYFLCLVMISITVNSQSINWITLGSGDVFTSPKDNGYFISADENSYYLSGTTHGLSFSKFTDTTFTNTNFSFISKYNNEGILEWVKTKPSTFRYPIALNSKGDLLVSGRKTLTKPSIEKFDSDGNSLWDKDIMINTIFPRTRSIQLDNNDNIYVSGEFRIFNSPVEIGDTTLNLSGGGEYGYIAKYDDNGNFIWINVIQGASSTVWDLALDSENNVDFIGQFQVFEGDSIVIGDQVFYGNLGEVTGAQNGLVGQLNTTGQLNWAKPLDATGPVWGNKISVNSQDMLHITGTYDTFLEVDQISLTSNGMSDVYLGQLNKNGEINWLYNAGGMFGADAGRGITIGKDDCVYFCGEFVGLASFTDMENNSIEVSTNGISGFLAKYTSDGILNSVNQIESSSARIQDVYYLNDKLLMTGNVFGSGSIFSETIPLCIPDADNFYFLSVNLNTSGFNDFSSFKNDLRIYPNPASHNILLESESGQLIDQIEIINSIGNTVLKRKIDMLSPIVNIESLDSGYFIINTYYDKQLIGSKRIIKI